MLSSMVSLLTKILRSTKLWPCKKNEDCFANMPTILKLRPNIFPKKNIQPFRPWIIGKKNFTVLLYSYTLKESYSNFALSAISELILLSVQKLLTSFLNLREAVLLLCTIFCGSREDASLTRLNWNGHLSAYLMRILMIICLHSYRNNLFFSAATYTEARTAFVPAPMSTRPGSSWFLILRPFIIQHASNWSCTVNCITSFLKIALSSSNINGTVGASVWKRVKYGSNIPATNEKKCNFAGTKGSE